jgi:hypothetical protein
VDDPRSCFRCKGLAVIDKGFLLYLPGILNRASELLATAKTDDEEELYNLRTSLRQYAVMLGMVPDD